MQHIKLLGISGSLRERSINSALLRACAELLPEGAELEIASLSALPLYNQDTDTDQPPTAVAQLRAQVASADAMLLVTPEYNHSIPGVLKNALDWASRPAYKAPISRKPVGMMSASPGAVGGARAQIALSATLLGMACHVYPHPGFCLGRAPVLFDDSLRLTDERTRDFARSYLAGLVDFARPHKQS